jgi:hypothetical protein
VLHYSRLSACYAGLNGVACSHVSLALMVTAALVRCALGRHEHAMETHESSCTARSGTPFFILEARGPQRVA